jgi:hypothetical protein
MFEWALEFDHAGQLADAGETGERAAEAGSGCSGGLHSELAVEDHQVRPTALSGHSGLELLRAIVYRGRRPKSFRF